MNIPVVSFMRGSGLKVKFGFDTEATFDRHSVWIQQLNAPLEYLKYRVYLH